MMGGKVMLLRSMMLRTSYTAGPESGLEWASPEGKSCELVRMISKFLQPIN